MIIRRRLAALVALVVIAVGAIVWFGPGQRALRELTLPLHHADIIRQQAREKNLDPALIAAVIFQETKFRPRTSAAGAEGLMQILPSTAEFLARRTHGITFVPSDLSTPQVNISYGCYYLRYLTDHYGGNLTLAVAAYNAGLSNVDQWVARAGGPSRFTDSDIPFPETRAYVQSVRRHRRAYRQRYAHELGYR
ncbi:MAG: lytic transglycosylase domain-containing protein [Actinobacteria bacterium]|nr:lytic transglycosylase domain-containing protein [Actinomycetota bacterium]